MLWYQAVNCTEALVTGVTLSGHVWDKSGICVVDCPAVALSWATVDKNSHRWRCSYSWLIVKSLVLNKLGLKKGPIELTFYCAERFTWISVTVLL